MLTDKKIYQIPTVKQLTNIWTNRYFPDLSELAVDSFAGRDQLSLVVSQQGRSNTAKKLDKRLLDHQCSLAAVRARDLYSYYGASAFKEAANLAKFISQIYAKLVDSYQGSAAVVISSQTVPDQSLETFSLEAWGLPELNQLANDLGSLLTELKQRHRTTDWQSVGFITTQISLSNALLLEQLAPTEQAFINCYFKFLEEQVSIPWQRVCLAAANHHSASLMFLIVEKMLPLATEISTIVYERWSQSFPSYNSRRGSFNDPGVRHSTIRDFDMFQAYLWLCCLEEQTVFIEQELSAICRIVFGALNIPWQMTVEGVLLLIDELVSRLEPAQQELIKPYTRAMIRTFSG